MWKNLDDIKYVRRGSILAYKERELMDISETTSENIQVSREPVISELMLVLGVQKIKRTVKFCDKRFLNDFDFSRDSNELVYRIVYHRLPYDRNKSVEMNIKDLKQSFLSPRVSNLELRFDNHIDYWVTPPMDISKFSEEV